MRSFSSIDILSNNRVVCNDNQKNKTFTIAPFCKIRQPVRKFNQIKQLRVEKVCQISILCYNAFEVTMKKSVLFLICVALICVACLTLTACNNATPQGQLGNYFSKYEKYTYALHDSKNNINGTY